MIVLTITDTDRDKSIDIHIDDTEQKYPLQELIAKVIEPALIALKHGSIAAAFAQYPVNAEFRTQCLTKENIQ